MSDNDFSYTNFTGSDAPDVSTDPTPPMDYSSMPALVGNDAPAAPSMGDTTDVPNSNVLVAPAQQSVAPVQQPNQPISWRDVLRGALAGMAGAAQPTRGRGSFAQGMGMGAGAELQDQTQQQQLKFESVRAADSHIAALDAHRRMDALADEDKARVTQLNLQNQITLRDQFGIEPTITVSDSEPTEHAAGIQTLATQNGGTIPSVVTTNSPAPKGTPGSIAVYSTTPTDIKNNPNGARSVVDTAAWLQGQGPIDDASWIYGGPKEQTNKVNKAISVISSPVPGSNDPKKPDYIGTQIQVRRQQAANAAKTMDSNDPATAAQRKAALDQFNKGTDFLQSVMDNNNKTAIEERGGGAVDTGAVKTFQTETLPSYTHISKAQQNGLIAESAQAQTHDDFEKIQTKALSLEQSGQVHADTQANIAANKGSAMQNKGLEANEKVWNDPKTGFSATLTQANQGRASIKAGVDGNGLLTSLEPTMTILGINHAAGMNRISPVEAASANAPGGWREQWNAWATKAGSGKLSPQLAQEGQQLFDILVNGKQAEATRNSRLIANGHNIPYNQVPAMDKDGNVTTLDKVVPQAPPQLPAVAPQAPPQLPAAAANTLVEGHNTTFANGQVWTKQSGKPMRVK